MRNFIIYTCVNVPVTAEAPANIAEAGGAISKPLVLLL